MLVHLVDGTYELFRYFLSPAAAFDRSAPEELRAVRGVVASILGMLEGGVTHLGVATDQVIESFRNALWPGYKTGEGLDPLLDAQFQPLEEALSALGVVTMPWRPLAMSKSGRPNSFMFLCMCTAISSARGSA